MAYIDVALGEHRYIPDGTEFTDLRYFVDLCLTQALDSIHVAAGKLYGALEAVGSVHVQFHAVRAGTACGVTWGRGYCLPLS